MRSETELASVPLPVRGSANGVRGRAFGRKPICRRLQAYRGGADFVRPARVAAPAALVTLAAALLLAAIAGAHPPTANYQQAKRIIGATFPAATAAAALRVVRCETGGTYSPDAYNRSSGATGYFQILRGNGGRVLHYRGTHLTIDGGRLFQPWYNARVALFLSRGGTDWREWVCRP